MTNVSIGPSSILIWIGAVLSIGYAVVEAIDNGLDTSSVILAGIGAAMLIANNYSRSKQAEKITEVELPTIVANKVA